jgi:fatty-acyl-CoA synthase
MPATPLEPVSSVKAVREDSPAKAWLRALERTSSIGIHPERTFATVLRDMAEVCGDLPALISDHEQLTYRELIERSHRYARWALEQGLGKGRTVALLMPNRPEYIAIWVGITQTGAAVALLNTNLKGSSLAHCINAAAPELLIADATLLDTFTTAQPHLGRALRIWVHGRSPGPFPRIDSDLGTYSAEPLSENEAGAPTIEDRALYIYTSGTTGLPKAAIVSHGRIMQWTHWFAGLMGIQSTDRMYNCLPMYHSVGGVQATGAVLAAGGAVIIREKFSARCFWDDLVRWDCTLFQYIGELCRYLLNTPQSPRERAHRIRLACGNGLKGDIWNEFKQRFRVPRILEFYAATEGNVSFFNVDGQPGSVGRIPSCLAHRSPVTLVRFNFETETPMRGKHGFCVPCGPNETGEAIGLIPSHSTNFGARFEGYAASGASERKILCDVFTIGDAWFRTGDLMRKDEKGYFYFVDRIGDTFRWKGENVATSEVSGMLCRFPGVIHATVYGVSIPGIDGRAGMAFVLADRKIDLKLLRAYIGEQLPEYARPLFLRLGGDLEVTSTYKYTTQTLRQQGYHPSATAEALYFDDPEHGYIRLDEALYRRIQAGDIGGRSCKSRVTTV